MPEKFQLPRSTPEAQGVSTARIAEFVTTAEKSLQNLHSFMLLRHGQVIAEGWWHPWKPEMPHMLFSLSKSFTSTAVGMAVAEGRLTLADPVLSFFEEEAPRRVSDNLRAMKVHHLLSMSTGHDQDTTDKVRENHHPFKQFLSLPVEHAPGTHFVYNSGASFMLSAIIQKLTDQTLLEYLQPRLFELLGIEGAIWESHPNGVNFGGWGLSLKIEDITRFGKLYLQRGEWNGQRILAEDWVKEASKAQVSNGDDPNSDWAQGYGYHFWRCRHNIYRGDGAFGQYCIIMPDQAAVLAITSGVSDMQAVLNLVWDKLLPALEAKPVHGTTTPSISYPFKDLCIPPPQGADTSSIARQISGKRYTFEPNSETLHSLSVNFSKEGGTISYRLLGGGKRRGNHQLAFGYESWREGVTYLGVPTPLPVAASGAWTAEDTFTLTLCLTTTPFIATLTFKFEDHKLLYSYNMHPFFEPLNKPQIIGIAE